ncbi:MAG TPA: hemolysin family protein, partial [Microbacteriaceae bacterium]|nr:hemolysin family protein [Microbacteriaceae bacterium]
LFAAGILLTLGTGVFVASEFSLVNLDRPDIDARHARGERRMGLVAGALHKTSTHLSSAQLGITLTTLLTGFTLEPAIASLLAPAFAFLPPAALAALAALVSVVGATLVSMVIGELVPKNIALALPIPTAKLVLPFQVAFTAVFRPVVKLFDRTANAVLRSVGVTPREELTGARTAAELSSLVRRSAGAGLLEGDTARLLDRTLRLPAHTASDAMTPRPRVSSIGRDDSAADVVTLARTTGFSRFPVLGDDADDVVGVVHVKNAVAVPPAQRGKVPVSALQTAVVRVPETMPLDTLLGELRARGFQMAVVADEYGGTAGIVTLEDLVEELVGEVSDEHDRLRVGVVRRPGSVTFPGLLRPDELAERASLLVPEEGPYETIAGFVVNELGRMPRVGDEVAVAGGTLRVERLDGRRIDRLRFTPDAPPAEGALPEEGAAP